MPVRLAGHPALEFCNTWAGWDKIGDRNLDQDPRREYLRDFDRFAVWAGYVELCDQDGVGRLRAAAARHPALAARTLDQAHRFRGHLYRTLTDGAGAESAFDQVAALTQRASAASLLVRMPDGGGQWELPRTVGLELPLLSTARAAGELLVSPAVHQVKACPGPDCGWLFLDSRGRRTWCSMSACGNRAKARTFAARHARGAHG